MHFVRRDYVFFYDKGIVCYKSTPVPLKKIIKHDRIDKITVNNYSKLNEPDCKLIDFIDEQYITLVPTKPLNLINPTLGKIRPLDTICEPEPKEIRPNIALNTLYSLVYPASVTGNTFNISPKKCKVKVKPGKYGLFYKICERDAEKINKTKCRRCTFTNIFDKDDYLYTCPETINGYRAIDLYLNKLNVNKYHNLDNNDLEELYYIKPELGDGQPNKSIDINVIENRPTSAKFEGEWFNDDNTRLNYCMPLRFEDRPVNKQPRSISEASECIKSIEWDKSLSNKYPTIYSIASSLASEPTANEGVIDRQQSKICRILSNEEICEVIESPNVIRSIESFHIQLSRLSSKTTFRKDSHVFTKGLISQDSNSAFNYPLEAKSTKSSILSSIRSEQLSPKLEESDDSAPIPSEDKTEVGSIDNDTIYNRASTVRSIQESVKEPPNSNEYISDFLSKIDSIKATESNESFHNEVPNSINISPSIQPIKPPNSYTLASVPLQEVPEQVILKIDSYKSNISAESVKSLAKLDSRGIGSDKHERIIETPTISIEEEETSIPTIGANKACEADADESKEYKIHEYYQFSDQKGEEPGPERVEYLKNELEADVISRDAFWNDDSNDDENGTEKGFVNENDQIDANGEKLDVCDSAEDDKHGNDEIMEASSIDNVAELKDVEVREEVTEPPSTYDKKHTTENVAYEVYYNSNKEVVRPLKDNRNNVLVKGFTATVFIVNSNKTATSSLCTIMFNYEEDLLIIKSASDIFEIKATDLTSEEIPTSPGSPILLKITLNNNLFSAIVIQSDVGKNLEILAGTIGWANNRRKTEFKDKAPRMNVRKSLFAGLKNNKRVDKVDDLVNRNSNKRGKTGRKPDINKNKVDKQEVIKDKESVRTGGLFSRIRRKRNLSNKAK